ncbi:MAG: N-acetyltransferase [Phycisphaerales bacterium]|nr:N-acetyltransferase [Phycisphaerales bacterium]
MNPLIRRATAADLPAIFAIYNDEIRNGTATFDTEPMSAQRQDEWLAAHTPDTYAAFVAGDPGFAPNHGVLGWATLSPWSNRCAYARAAEVSVYVHREARGHRVGHALLRHLVDHAPQHGVFVLLARIAEGNPVSIRLHESVGFREIGVMRRVGEKFGRILDVTVMDLHLDGG